MEQEKMIEKIELSEIPGRRCNYNNPVAQECKQFSNSDWDACEVNIKKYKNVGSAIHAYRKSIRNLGLNIVPVQREGRLFLIRAYGKE